MQKVLLVCLDNLGDLVFTSALADALRADPNVELSLWCKDYTARMGHLLPGVQQVFASDPFWDKSPGRAKGSWFIFFRTMHTIRKKKFDLALLPSTCWRTAWFLRLIGIPSRIGLHGSRNLMALSATVPIPSRQKPIVAGLLSSFKAWVGDQTPAITCLDKKRLPQLQLPLVLQNRPYVCIHAFAGRRDRCASLEIFQALARMLEAQGLAVLWMGTHRELQEIRDRPDAPSTSLYADRWAHDLLSVAWLISRATLFIGHDSGPLHVAGALQIPVLGFYLPGEPKRTMPQGGAAAVMVVRENPSLLDVKSAEAALHHLQQRMGNPELLTL